MSLNSITKKSVELTQSLTRVFDYLLHLSRDRGSSQRDHPGMSLTISQWVVLKRLFGMMAWWVLTYQVPSTGSWQRTYKVFYDHHFFAKRNCRLIHRKVFHSLVRDYPFYFSWNIAHFPLAVSMVSSSVSSGLSWPSILFDPGVWAQ